MIQVRYSALWNIKQTNVLFFIVNILLKFKFVCLIYLYCRFSFYFYYFCVAILRGT